MMQLGSMFISKCNITLHVSDAFCVHPQEHLKTVVTASGVWHEYDMKYPIRASKVDGFPTKSYCVYTICLSASVEWKVHCSAFYDFRGIIICSWENFVFNSRHTHTHTHTIFWDYFLSHFKCYRVTCSDNDIRTFILLYNGYRDFPRG